MIREAKGVRVCILLSYVLRAGRRFQDEKQPGSNNAVMLNGGQNRLPALPLKTTRVEYAFIVERNKRPCAQVLP